MVCACSSDNESQNSVSKFSVKSTELSVHKTQREKISKLTASVLNQNQNTQKVQGYFNETVQNICTFS